MDMVKFNLSEIFHKQFKAKDCTENINGEKLIKNPEYAMQCMLKSKYRFSHPIMRLMRENLDVTLFALKKDYNNYRYVSDKFKDDSQVIIQTIGSCIDGGKYFKLEQLLREEVLDFMTREQELAYKFLPPSLTNNPEFIENNARKNLYILGVAGKDVERIIESDEMWATPNIYTVGIKEAQLAYLIKYNERARIQKMHKDISNEVPQKNQSTHKRKLNKI